MTVVTDWRDGRIQGWTEAPVLAVEGVTTNSNGKKAAKTDEVTPDQKEIVTEWAKEFKLDGLWGDAAAVDDAADDVEMQ